MNWYRAESTDLFGYTFFSRSLLRSKYFWIAGLANLAVLAGCLWFFIAYRSSHLSFGLLVLVFVCVFIRALSSISSAVMRHQSLRNIYFAENSQGTFEQANAALSVSARAMLDDVFYTSVTLLVFLYVISFLLRHT